MRADYFATATALQTHEANTIREFARVKAELLRQQADVLDLEALHCYHDASERAKLEGRAEGLREAAALLGGGDEGLAR